MDTVWIPVFVMTLAECIAPTGKTVCQERELQIQFMNQAECEVALDRFITIGQHADNVIINKENSNCAPSVKQGTAFKTLEEANARFANTPGWQAPAIAESEKSVTETSYDERLASLPNCDTANGVTPCRINDIIIEGPTTKSVEVWRKQE